MPQRKNATLTDQKLALFRVDSRSQRAGQTALGIDEIVQVLFQRGRTRFHLIVHSQPNCLGDQCGKICQRLLSLFRTGVSGPFLHYFAGPVISSHWDSSPT